MGYFDTDQLDNNDTTAGSALTFGESISAGFEQQFRVNSPYSLEIELQDRFLDSLKALEQRTGQTFDFPTNGLAFDQYAKKLLGEPVQQQKDILFRDTGEDLYAPAFVKFQQANEAIKALNDPNVKAFEDVLREVSEMQMGVEERAERSSTFGWFLGSIAGAFTTRDPGNIATLGLGGFGKTIGARVLSEIGVGAAVATPSVLLTNENRQALGLPTASALEEIAIAGLGAGIFRGVLEGAAVGAGRLLGRRSVEPLDLNNGEIRAGLAEAPQTPSVRAAIDIIDSDTQLRVASPYGDSTAGLLRFTGELEDVYRAMNGQADTAIARVLPDIDTVGVKVLEADTAIVRAENPSLYNAFIEAEARVQELDVRIQAVEAGLNDVRLSDAVARVDPDSGALVRSFEDDLIPTLSARDREAIEARINQIVESLGVENVERQLGFVNIKPKKELQGLRAERRSAKKTYRALRQGMEAEIARVRQRQLVKELREASLTKPSPTPIGLPFFRRDFVETEMGRVAEMARTAPEQAVRTVQRNVPQTEGETVVREVEEGMVDIGLSEPVPANTRFVVTDDNGVAREVSAEQVMRDLADDKALEDAMRSCAI